MAPRLPIVLVALALVLSVPLLALRSGGDAGAAGAVRVELGEYSVAAPATLAPGRVTLETVNRGRLEHELLILRTDRPAGDLPMGLEGPALELAGELVLGEAHGHSSHEKTRLRGGPPRHIRPGRTRRDTVTLAPGRYVLLCNLPGHYAAGQRAALVVR